MHTADVIRILKEEKQLGGDAVEMMVRTQIRISTDIAKRIILPSLTAEQWGIFQELLKADILFRTARPTPMGPLVIIRTTQYFHALETLERAHMLLLNTHFGDSALIHGRTYEELLNVTCKLSLEREDLIKEHEGQKVIAYEPSGALQVSGCIGWAMAGLAGEASMQNCVDEINAAVVVLQAYLGG